MKEPICGWNYFYNHKCENCKREVECLKKEKKRKDIELKQKKKLKRVVEVVE